MQSLKRNTAVVSLLAGAILAAPTQSSASIVEITIAAHSQANSRPPIDNVFDNKAVNGVFNENLGIGIIINPIFIPANVQSDFALHQNGYLFAPSAYSNYVPNPLTSDVMYRFDHPTIVSGVEVVEHYNGVTGIGGSLGNSPQALVSLGSVLGPSSMVDGTIVTFDFGNTTRSGTYFQLSIDRTLLSYAFALHRAYLLDQYGRIIPGSTMATPEPNSFGSLICGLGVLGYGAFARRRRHSLP